MAERSYVDFDLQIEWVGTGYRARVLESPAGQAQAEFTLPFTDLELENFILRIGQRRSGRRRTESKDLDSARDFGTTLFQSVFQNDIAGAYRSSLLFAEHSDAGLRVRLRLSGAPDLCDIPWEFLFDPTARRFVALSANSPIVRFLDVPGVTTPLKIEPPIKVLVVIASPADFEQLQVEDEWSRLDEALRPMIESGALALERLEKPTLAALQRALRRDYHVLHFVGHGGFDEQRQDGLLVFEDEQGRGNEVSATYLSTLLHDADSLRLAVLNACDGARSSRTDQFAGVAQSLLQQGVPAVVAMQFAISDDAALTFAREFYGAFADGYPVEAALAEARKSMFALQNDSEWATPVLYLRTSGNAIFEITAPPKPAVAETPMEAHPSARPAAGEVGAASGAAPTTRAEPSRALEDSAPEAESSSSGRTEPHARTGTGSLGTGDGRDGWGRWPWLAAAAFGALFILSAIGGLLLYGGDPEDPEDPPETPTLAVPAEVDFNGTWFTNFSRLEMTQTGSTVTGQYQRYTTGAPLQTLQGTINGRTLAGTFDGSVNKFAFTLSDDGETFDGYWMSPTGEENEWCGNLEFEEQQDGCGYSGEWLVKGLPSSLEVTDDIMFITQLTDRARVAFNSDRYGPIVFDTAFDERTLALAAGTMTLQAPSNPTLRFEITFLVSEFKEWDQFRGTWRQTLPSGGLSGGWCAYRSGSSPPC